MSFMDFSLIYGTHFIPKSICKNQNETRKENIESWEDFGCFQ